MLVAYSSLRQCVNDLERVGDLRTVDIEVDPFLELGMIQRRAYRAGAPALLFSRLKGCRFPALANLYGTRKRARYVLRHGYRAVEALAGLKANPKELIASPGALLRSILTGLSGVGHALPVPVSARRAPVLAQRLSKDELPAIVSWPADGGPFVTLPAVYTQSLGQPWWRGAFHSNLGMYRCQVAGRTYSEDEVGLHYQLHRGIGLHHQEALAQGLPLQVQIAVGGPPSLAFSAVMPLPEKMPELLFAGVLGGRGVRFARPSRDFQMNAFYDLPVLAEADFLLLGSIAPGAVKPEGPFGDHLGYYSLIHDFPVMHLDAIWARKDAIWPFTTVGRPPQEDSVLGEVIHELTGPLLPGVLPGVKSVNAVDEAGVHPLLLAVASERYEPYRKRRRPQEILTIAHSILGFGQLSLAKYLLVVAGEDDPLLEAHDSRAIFCHLLERIDWTRDLHFHTETTIDTLDYTGPSFQQGSKLVMAACGPPIRHLPTMCPVTEEGPFRDIRVVAPGILALSGPAFDPQASRSQDPLLSRLESWFPSDHLARSFPLWVVTEQASYLAQDWANFLWVTFTRSDPASDVYGIESFTFAKHWGARGPLVIDARLKPHHAPVLEEDAALVRRVEALAAPGQPLHGIY